MCYHLTDVIRTGVETLRLYGAGQHQSQLKQFMSIETHGRPMKRRTYRIIFATLLIIGTALVSSCSSDSGSEPEENTTLTGSWQMKSVTMKGTPVGNLTLSAESFLGMSGTGAVRSVLTLNEDGSAVTVTSYEAAADHSEPGQWLLDGDLLSIDGAGIDDSVPYLLQNRILTLTVIMAIDFEQDGTAQDTEVDMSYEKL